MTDNKIIDGQSIPLEIFMSRYFVKYKRLDQLISFAFANSNANSIDLFIDLYGIYKSIFSRGFRTNVTDYTSFTSTLVNMCGHYRSYFKMLGVSTRIFVVSSYNISEINGKFVAGYNKTFQEKIKNTMIGDMVSQNIELMQILFPYLPDIHFVKSEFESSVVIHNIIAKEKATGRNVPNIIISTDLYPIQLTTLWEDTAFIRPKKSLGEDVSEIVCPISHSEHENTFWSIICHDKEDFSLNQNAVLISSRNFVLLSALNRFPDRNIKALVNFNKANKIIYAITNGADIKIKPDMLNNVDPILVEGIPINIVDSRYKALDVEYQSLLYNESLEPVTLEFTNLTDNDAIQLINDTYFSNNPIDIYKL